MKLALRTGGYLILFLIQMKNFEFDKTTKKIKKIKDKIKTQFQESLLDEENMNESI